MTGLRITSSTLFAAANAALAAYQVRAGWEPWSIALSIGLAVLYGLGALLPAGGSR